MNTRFSISMNHFWKPTTRNSARNWASGTHRREIVKYQVARVDTVLREELDLPDGLADPNVIVLDPCCGTGAYLVEVLTASRGRFATNMTMR